MIRLAGCNFKRCTLHIGNQVVIDVSDFASDFAQFVSVAGGGKSAFTGSNIHTAVVPVKHYDAVSMMLVADSVLRAQYDNAIKNSCGKLVTILLQ
jgi:hypothetical protein